VLKKFLRTILHLAITTIVLVIFNEGAMFTLHQATKLSGTISLISLLAYGPLCFLLARNLEFGRWKYVFYIPFINEILYIIVIYNTNIRNFFPLEEDDFGVAIMMLPITLIMWVVFISSTLTGIHIRKKEAKWI
jgi:hypothetical protein